MSPADSQRHQVTTADGRTLSVVECGDPSGAPVLAHHGTPGSSLFDPAWSAPAAALGVRLVAWDRAGYGESSADPGRTVASAAKDAAAVADALGLDRFATWGISGGGPHTLACAALLPDRVTRVAVLAGVAPYDAPGLDWLAGMGQDNLEEFAATLAGEAELRRYLESAGDGLKQALARDPQAVIDEMASLLPPVDAAYIRSHGSGLDAMARGIAPGIEGWLEDDLAFAAPWGFDLAAMTTPTLVLQGNQDLMVPAAHGHYLAATIPGADFRVLPDDGHLTLLNRLDEIHGWLTA